MEEIVQALANSDNFYEQVASVALASLMKCYGVGQPGEGDELTKSDVVKVIDAMKWAAESLPE